MPAEVRRSIPSKEETAVIEVRRSPRRWWGRIPLLVLLPLTWALAGAMPQDDDEDTGPPDVCLEPFVEGIVATPYLNGLPLVFEPVEIVGDRVKVVVATTTRCRPITPSALPFIWDVTGPLGSVELTNPGLLRPHFRPAVAGAYQATITYCPDTCEGEQVGPDTLDIPKLSASFSFTVVDEIPLPPASQVVLTPTGRAAPTPAQWALENERHALRETMCGGADDLQTPQLVPVRPWDENPANYVFLAGFVEKSGIAGKDNELNHTSHDIGIHVKPDPQYELRMIQGRRDMEIEWESNSLPGPMRPLAGDRVSAWGFHTFDCHHAPIATEIHPPVMTAVHRPRAIRIADGWAPPGGVALGSNLYVPGIVTDIWANNHAGEMTSNCSSTGLHEEAVSAPAPLYFRYGDCIKSPHPLARTFEFNIYLPENPQKRMAAAGMVAPPAPLYVEVDPPLQPGDPLKVVEEVDGDVTYLRVTLNLANYGGSTYTRRIVAGWVQPSPDNWGLERWKLGIAAIHVYHDHDTGTDGDWVFWAAINNRDKEWTRLFNGEGLGEGYHDFGGRPWETGCAYPVDPGCADPGRSLGPHLLLFNPPFGHLFPGLPELDLTQSRYLHTSGYDAELFDDPVGLLTSVVHPVASSMAIGERLYWNEYSGFVADYRLTNYLERLGPVGGATLTDAGRDLLEAYTIRREGARCTVVRRGLCVFLPEGESLPWHPLHTALDPRKPDLDWLDHPIFKPQGKEERSLTDIPLAVLGRSVASAQLRDPQRVDRFFRELREEFDAVRGTLQEAEFARALPPFEANLPADLWQFYFGDIDPTPVDLVAQRLEMSPPGASAGQKVVFSVQVSNRGKGTAAPFKVRLEIDGTGVELSVPGLAPGVAITVAFPPWTATPGKHSVRGIADASARIAEPVEDDNVLERRFLVRRTAGGLPDLRPLPVRLEPSPPRAGEPLFIVARVRNTGGNALDAFAVRFVIDGATIGEATVPGLPARELVEVRSPSWAAVPGGHALQVIVDAGQAVVEADEGNNAHARSFRVKPGRH